MSPQSGLLHVHTEWVNACPHRVGYCMSTQSGLMCVCTHSFSASRGWRDACRSAVHGSTADAGDDLSALGRTYQHRPLHVRCGSSAVSALRHWLRNPHVSQEHRLSHCLQGWSKKHLMFCPFLWFAFMLDWLYFKRVLDVCLFLCLVFMLGWLCFKRVLDACLFLCLVFMLGWLCFKRVLDVCLFCV